MGEPQKTPALRFVWAAMRRTLERHEFRFLRMQGQSELLEAREDALVESLGVCLAIAEDHKVIRKAH